MFAKLLKKYRVHLLILIELVVLVVFIPGLLKGNVLCSSLSSEEFSLEGSEYNSNSIAIPRGVLRVNVYVNPLDTSYSIETRRLDFGTYHGMSCNEISVFPGQEEVSYEIYVTDKSAIVSFVTHGQNSEVCPISRVEVYNTHKAHGVIMCILFAFFCCIDALLLFRKRIIEKSNLKAEIVFFVLAVCTLISLMPELTNYISFGTKGMDEIIKIETMRKTIAGKEAFFSSYYKDLYLIIPVLLRLIGFPIMVAYKANIVLIAILTVFITYKALRILHVNSNTALVITVLYILCPYRLYMLYYACDMRCYTAMVFPPLMIIPLLQTNMQVIKDYLSTGTIITGCWALACISLFLMRKKKKAVAWIVVLLVIATAWYLGEIAINRNAIWLYNIENFYRM